MFRRKISRWRLLALPHEIAAHHSDVPIPCGCAECDDGGETSLDRGASKQSIEGIDGARGAREKYRRIISNEDRPDGMRIPLQPGLTKEPKTTERKNL